jgi:aminoglycoside 6'-N-acetyltransferase I
MEIRSIELNDLDALGDVFVSVFNSAPWNESWKKPWVLERLGILFNSYGFCGFLAEDDTEVVGAVFSRLGSYMGERELEISEMYVDGNHQRRGVGAALITEIQNYSIANSISCLVLQTDKHTFAKDFYLGLGFKGHEQNLLMTKQIKC